MIRTVTLFVFGILGVSLFFLSVGCGSSDSSRSTEEEVLDKQVGNAEIVIDYQEYLLRYTYKLTTEKEEWNIWSEDRSIPILLTFEFKEASFGAQNSYHWEVRDGDWNRLFTIHVYTYGERRINGTLYAHDAENNVPLLTKEGIIASILHGENRSTLPAEKGSIKIELDRDVKEELLSVSQSILNQAEAYKGKGD